MKHGVYVPNFGEYADPERLLSLARATEESGWDGFFLYDHLVDDAYGMAPGDPVPDDPKRARGWKVHHVMFGIKLKEKMDRLGIEADLKYPDAQTTYRSNAHFFIERLAKAKESRSE